jgi:ketosteroid isomerase-like protein
MPLADGATEQAPDVLDALYRAIESFDASPVLAALRPDVFVFSPTADGVLTSGDAVVRDLERWSRAVAHDGATLRLHSTRRVVGTSPSGQGSWVFDDLIAEARSNGMTLCSVPIRVTALLVSDDGWRIAAAYWSIPFPTQDDQDAVKHAGDLAPGNALDESVGEGAEELVAGLRRALAQPAGLPGLYSAREDHVTIGSVVEEVFLGGAGRAAWTEFVEYVTAFVPRGGMRAAVAGPDVAWLAANIDIGSPPTPYRFFYVWIHRDDSWEIVVSHDAVSRDPLAALPTVGTPSS